MQYVLSMLRLNKSNHRCCVQHLTGAGGKWGRMDAGRWNGFLDWLSDQVSTDILFAGCSRVLRSYCTFQVWSLSTWLSLQLSAALPQGLLTTKVQSRSAPSGPESLPQLLATSQPVLLRR